MSLLPVIEKVDNFPYDASEGLYTLIAHDGVGKLGFVVKEVAQELSQFPETLTVNENNHTITLNGSLDTLEKRTEALGTVAATLRNKDAFVTLKGWRDEQYVVYYPQHTPYALLERAFCPLLGVVMYGVHLNGYVKSSSGEYRFWVPRRSSTKATFPGMLDNTVAGGMGHPYGPYETMVKESHEEAGLPKEYIEKKVRSAGCCSYIYLNTEEGGIVQPEVQFIYDIELDEDTRPFPVDNESEDFQLFSLEQVLELLHKGEFKPNCGLVLVDFLVRHGLLDSQTDPAYLEISQRTHRRLPFATL